MQTVLHPALPRPWAKLVLLLGLIAAAFLAALMVLTVVDIVARSTGIFSVYGIIELSRATLLLVGCFGQAYVFSRQAHIVVDFFSAAFPQSVAVGLDRLSLVLAAIGLALLAWYMAHGAWEMHQTGERTETLQLSPLIARVPAAFGLLVSSVTAILLALAPPGARQQGLED